MDTGKGFDATFTIKHQTLIHHACGLRECNHAQWEIRDLFTNVNSLVKAVAPITFAKLGPSCVTKGICSEGSRCCGRVNSL